MIVARRITHSTSKMITNGVCTCLLLTTVTFAKLKNKHVSSDSQPDITSDRLQEIHENAHNCTERPDSSMAKRHAPSWVHLEEYTQESHHIFINTNQNNIHYSRFESINIVCFK